jgi:hypothetical protein
MTTPDDRTPAANSRLARLGLKWNYRNQECLRKAENTHFHNPQPRQAPERYQLYCQKTDQL